jgi:hypothetical protein
MVGRHSGKGLSVLPPFVWPALLATVLMVGICAGFVLMRKDGRPKRQRYFQPGACAEASLSISAGALLWIGFWDFMDTYLVPVTWWAKLCMLCLGAVGVMATRSLYPVQPPSPHDEEGTSVVESPRLAAVESPTHPRAELSPIPQPLSPSGRRPHRGRTSCGFLQPPTFNCAKCTRALVALFAGLTMWVGLWDLLDVHILPALVTECAHEPSPECAAVKLGLVAVGAFGLYLTRSLYGEDGSSGPVQFQRL